MNIIFIDNYDSFTYNLAHLVKSLGAHVDVVRNDKFQLPDLQSYDKILLSPGPGIPDEAGLTLKVIEYYAGKKPILGVCLGHQAIGQYFGAHLENLTHVYHGVQTDIRITRPDYLFQYMPEAFPAGRYHSWVIDSENLPPCLEVTAESEEHQIMALRHRVFDVRGIQFHPESVLTPNGETIINNWLKHTATAH